MHSLGPYVIEIGVSHLETLNGESLGRMVNGSRLKLLEMAKSMCSNLGCAIIHVS
jgi:hypothetical protein